MAVFKNYLTFERRVARGTIFVLRFVGKNLFNGIRILVSTLCSRYTIVFMPHDHRKPLSFSFNAGTFAVVACLLASSALLVPLFRSNASESSARLTETAAAFAQVRTGAEALRGEIGDLSSSSSQFSKALDRVDAAIALAEPKSSTGASGGILSLLSFDLFHKGGSTELDWMISERKKLEESTVRMAAAGNAIKSIRDTLEGIPTAWPVRGGIGHVSQPFGLNPNPFTGMSYLHKGMDISTYRSGDPIIATADGVVISAFYDSVSGYGNNVILKHKYGYTTRFGHMMAFRVHSGQIVKQGDIIGYIGNTGLSTGPHVHYEVQLGPDLLDPKTMILSPNS